MEGKRKFKEWLEKKWHLNWAIENNKDLHMITSYVEQLKVRSFFVKDIQ